MTQIKNEITDNQCYCANKVINPTPTSYGDVLRMPIDMSNIRSKADLNSYIGQRCDPSKVDEVFKGLFYSPTSIENCRLYCSTTSLTVTIDYCRVYPVAGPNEKVCSESNNQVYQNNVMVAVCPYGCRDGLCQENQNTSCIEPGAVKPDNLNPNSYLICQNNVWTPFVNGDSITWQNCTNEIKSIYLDDIKKIESYLFPPGGVTISCRNGGGGGEAGGKDPNAPMVIYCDPTILENYKSCLTTLIHEFAHTWQSRQTSIPGGNQYFNEDFNQNVLGCSAVNQDGVYQYTLSLAVDEEVQNTFIGYQNGVAYSTLPCSEAFALANNHYVGNPCYMKEKYALQYNWLKENIYQGVEFCEDQKAMCLNRTMTTCNSDNMCTYLSCYRKCAPNDQLAINACPSPTPIPTGSFSKDLYCQTIITKNECSISKGCSWISCFNGGNGGCFPENTAAETVCRDCSKNTNSKTCNISPDSCDWYVCPNGTGKCGISAVAEISVCSNDSVGCNSITNKTDCDNNFSIGCAWFNSDPWCGTSVSQCYLKSAGTSKFCPYTRYSEAPIEEQKRLYCADQPKNLCGLWGVDDTCVFSPCDQVCVPVNSKEINNCLGPSPTPVKAVDCNEYTIQNFPKESCHPDLCGGKIIPIGVPSCLRPTPFPGCAQFRYSPTKCQEAGCKWISCAQTCYENTVDDSAVCNSGDPNGDLVIQASCKTIANKTDCDKTKYCSWYQEFEDRGVCNQAITSPIFNGRACEYNKDASTCNSDINCKWFTCGSRCDVKYYTEVQACPYLCYNYSVTSGECESKGCDVYNCGVSTAKPNLSSLRCAPKGMKLENACLK
jgi:hypothetical protein